MRYLYMGVSLGLLGAGYYGMYYEPALPGHHFGLVDLYEGMMCLAGAVGFAIASAIASMQRGTDE